MNRQYKSQAGFSAIIAVILVTLLALLGTYMATQATIGSLSTTQSLGSMQAWFATRSAADWTVYQAQNRPACTCGTNCCTSAPAIQSATINYSVDGLNGFQTTVSSCTETAVTEASANYCVYNLTLTTQKGSPGGVTYLSKTINLSITDAP